MLYNAAKLQLFLEISKFLMLFLRLWGKLFRQTVCETGGNLLVLLIKNNTDKLNLSGSFVRVLVNP